MLYMTRFGQGFGNRHEREHAAGEMLLAHALSEEYGISPLPRVSRGENGKPYFSEYRNIYFNISHSGDMAVCALGGMELGVDIERMRAVKEGMIRRVLTGREREWLTRSADKEEAFIRLWTLKESYVKATGEGLRVHPDAVEFVMPEKQGEIRCSREGFAFWQQKLGWDACLSLCVRGRTVPEDMKKLHIVFL